MTSLAARRSPALLLVPAVVLALAIALAQPVRAHAASAKTPRIVHGNSVSPTDYAARWKWLAAIVDPSRGNDWDGQFCGGSLIAPRVVLTAAHCLSGDDVPSSMVVVLGRRTLTASDGVRIPVSRYLVSPGYDPDTMVNDVALIELSTPATTITPVTTISPSEYALWGGGNGLAVSGASGPWIAGWGDLCSNCQQYPTDLHEAEVPVAADATCAGTAGGGLGSSIFLSTMFCAGVLDSGANDGVDTCQGDSGGPVIVSDGAGGWRDIGITSWGYGCASDTYGVYTRVADEQGWINAQIGCGFGTGADSTCPSSGVVVAGGGGLPTPVIAPTPPPAPAAPAAPTPPPAIVPRDLVAPTQPGKFALSKATRRSLLLRWGASTDGVGVVKYVVTRKYGHRWVVIGSTNATRRTFAVGGLKAGTTVYLRVSAVDAAGNISAPRAGTFRSKLS